MAAAKFGAILLLVTVISCALVAQTSHTAKEIALGRQLAMQEVRKSSPMIDPPVNGYVQQLANKIAAYAALPFPVVSKIVVEPRPRAFALPGGYLFLTTGTISRTESEGELAAILAHEIGHLIVSRPQHGAWAQTAGLASIPLWFGGTCARFNDPVLLPKNYEAYQPGSQAIEEEADVLALGYLIAAGYSPSDVVEAFSRFPSGVTPPILPPELSHVAETVVTTSQYQEMKDRLSVLVPEPIVRHIQPTLFR